MRPRLLCRGKEVLRERKSALTNASMRPRLLCRGKEHQDILVSRGTYRASMRPRLLCRGKHDRGLLDRRPGGRASMRPRLLCRDPAASMRPRLLCRGKLDDVAGRGGEPGCFNEAAAPMPRKVT